MAIRYRSVVCPLSPSVTEARSIAMSAGRAPSEIVALALARPSATRAPAGLPISTTTFSTPSLVRSASPVRLTVLLVSPSRKVSVPPRVVPPPRVTLEKSPPAR